MEGIGHGGPPPTHLRIGVTGLGGTQKRALPWDERARFSGFLEVLLEELVERPS